MPYLAAKYTGSKPHQLPIDGGTYHSTFQDFSIDLRYNLSSRPVVLTPFFRVVVPSHHYEYFAHSAVGRDLREYHVGTNLGRRLDPFLPKGYLQARYSYIFVERVLDISPNRSNAEVQFGYFLTPRLSLRGTLQAQYTHSGLNYHLANFPKDITTEQFPHHDQIAKTDLLDLGGGLSFAVNRSWGLFVTFGRSITGRNGHLHAAVVTAGVSRSFGGRSEALGNQPAEDALELSKTFVCTCARSK
jgi:hypothetical protein